MKLTDENTKSHKKKGMFVFSVAIVEIIIFLAGYALGTLSLTDFNANKDNAHIALEE